MSVVKPWGDEIPEYDYTSTTPMSLPSSLPCLGRPGFFLRGQSHLLAARPKIGKTSLLFRLVKEWWKSLDDAAPDVLWISEESPAVWGYRRSQDPDPPPSGFLTICYARDSTDWLRHAMWTSREVVIVDTASAVLGLDDENNNSEVNRVLRPWTDLCALQTKTLIIIHHHRKGDGTHGSKIAGAGAWSRSMDMILELSDEGEKRRLSAMGRFPIPDPIIYDSAFTLHELSPRECESCGSSFMPRQDNHVLCRTCFRIAH